MKHLAVLLLFLVCTPLSAADLTLPMATVVKVDESDAASVRLPERPWAPGTETPGTEGAVRRSVLRLADAGMTTLQLIGPLRAALLEDGYSEIFTCADAECGGFDFRFQLDLLGEPDMHVDLGNYRYVLTRKPGASPHTVALVASSAGTNGFVHVTEVSDASLPDISIDPTPPQPTDLALPPVERNDLIETLVQTGRAVLQGLEFGTGSAELNLAAESSLEALADWLAANPSARIILVGHTDAVGSLDANTDLSRRRALAVAGRLLELGTVPVQIQSAGAGYLSPVASNLTEDGRATNRRVEVVLLALDP